MDAFLTNFVIIFSGLCFAWAVYAALDYVFGERD